MTIRRFGVLSVGKMMGSLYAVLGLLIGGFFSLVGMLGASLGGGDGAAGAMFGAAAIVIFPIMYGVLGFLGGLLMAVLYNFLAGVVGGIELDADGIGRDSIPGS